MTIRLEDTVRVNPRCLLTELGDGTGVVLDLDTKFYFTLNATGVIVWKELVSRPAGTTAQELATKLEELFDVARDDAARDVLDILETMAREGLLQPPPATP